MKKIAVLAAVALLSLTACEKNTPVNPTPNPPSGEPKPPRGGVDECPRADKHPCF